MRESASQHFQINCDGYIYWLLQIHLTSGKLIEKDNHAFINLSFVYNVVNRLNGQRIQFALAPAIVTGLGKKCASTGPPREITTIDIYMLEVLTFNSTSSISKIYRYFSRYSEGLSVILKKL